MNEILSQVLTKDHRDAGLSIDEDDHLLYLRDKTGKILRVFWAASATPTAVLHEANQALEWQRSGVTFGSNRVLCAGGCGIDLSQHDHMIVNDNLYCPMCYYRLERDGGIKKEE